MVSANLKKAWAASLSGFAAFILSAASPAQAQETQKLFYDVYASGFHVVQAQLNMRFPQENRYEVKLDAHTRGFLGKIVPWEGTFYSKGWKVDEHYRPELHKSVSGWRGEIDVKEFNYTKAGGFKNLYIQEHGKEREKKELDPAVTQSTTDAFSMALNILQDVAQGKTCDGTEDVFDGKRRFEQRFTHQDNVMLTASRYNIYEGPAQKCTVEVTPVAGSWDDKPRGWLSIQEQGRQRGALPTVWIGQLSEDSLAVPIKILVKTAYGSLFMHLAEYQSGDSIIVADKRAEHKKSTRHR